MQFLRCLATAVVWVAFFSTRSEAHSEQRNPLTYVTTIDRPIINTPSNRVHFRSSFELTFNLHQKHQQIRLQLSPNHDVIAEGATVQYLAADGSVRHSEAISPVDHKVFKGQAFVKHSKGAEWTNVGWARIMIVKDGPMPVFEGAFQVDGNHHHILTRQNYLQTKHSLDPIIEDEDEDVMVVWRDSDVMAENLSELRRGLGSHSTCAADDLEFNAQRQFDQIQYTPMVKKSTGFWSSIYTRSLFGRQIDNSTSGNGGGVNLASTIGSTAGCPTTRKIALVGVATDCTYTAAFNSTASVRQNIILQMQLASVQYEDAFNITLGIQNLTISDASCPASTQAATPWNVACSDSVTIQDRLNLFSTWRGARPDSNAFWTLLSTCNTGNAVGLAWLGQACINTAQAGGSNETVSGANVVVRVVNSEWQVLAHETGHTFGAVHDCDSDACANPSFVAAQQCCPLTSSTCDANRQFIMNPSTGSGIQRFSPCSIGNICSALGRNNVKSTCLTSNRNIATITGSQCGNGIVEVGEDCDCGGPTGCRNNPCCNPNTCRFTTGSVCDNSNEDCCTSTCQFANSTTVCRPSTGSCDPQETCTGTSPICPDDQSAPNGNACGDPNAGLYCANGHCTSRDLQCQTLVGAITHDNSTYACSADGCQVVCGSPRFGRGTCAQIQQNFVDGTECGGGGRCQNGICQGSSVGGEISQWVNSNRSLVIGLAAGIGGAFVIALLCCVVSCCCRRRRGGVKSPRIPQPIPPPMRSRTQPTQPAGPHYNIFNVPQPPEAVRAGRRPNIFDGGAYGGQWGPQFGGGDRAARYA